MLGVFLLAFVALVLNAATVSAQDCDAYSTRAVSQNRENIARACGFSDQLWSSDRTYHLNWCRQDGDEAAAEKLTAIRETALDETCPTGKGDLAAASWCYEIKGRGPGSAIMLAIHPIVENAGGSDWYSTVGGSYSVAASGPSPVESQTRALSPYPRWSIAADESKRLNPITLPFHEENTYAFGWSLQSQSDLDPTNNEIQFHSLGSGQLFLDGGDLAHMKCEALGQTFNAAIPPSSPIDLIVRSSASPDIAQFEVGIHVAVVQPDGAVMVNATSAPGVWDGWSHILGIRGEPTTAPVLVSQESPDRLHLFVRDSGNNLFHAEKPSGAMWGGWSQITNGNEVRGRISVSQTSDGGRHFHVMFPGQSTGDIPVVVYRRYNSNLNVVHHEETYRGFVEGTLGRYQLKNPADPDDGDQLVQVLMATKGLRVLHRTSPWANASDITPSAMARATPGVLLSLDISEPVALGGGFHFAYTSARWPEQFGGPISGQLLRHAFVRPDAPADPRITTVAEFATDSIVVRSALALFRNRLVLGFNTPDGAISYGRLDMAVPSWPWIGAKLGPSVNHGANRLALAIANFRKIGPNWDVADYGNDLFAVLSDASLSGQVTFSNFSRTILQQESAHQFKIYESQSGASGCGQDGAQGSTTCNAPLHIGSVWAEERPFLTELGLTLWTWPIWFSDTAWFDAARLGCARGHRSGRFEEPCSAARYPVVSMAAGAGNPFIDGGAWVRRNSEVQDDILHELSHSVLDPIMGFVDSGSPPGSKHETRSGISESELRIGFQIFGEELIGVCDNQTPHPECPATHSRGFVNLDGRNYDQGSRQHSFIGAMRLYVHDGEQMRANVVDDLNHGHDLLHQKYEWIQKNIFGGLEFKDAYEPR
ncbi:hypothetical protein [Roseovarius sp. Pro17]|uniref:hypothetical protein n=1 Tax=Roseovarius sp. Pro17 TaxID=3108175 RepID=UPI002D7744D3|nr:hypothetical protein [Roseovarius sp. Pro17]